MTDLINKASRFFYRRQLGLLLIRVALGLIFLTHGLMKVEELSSISAFFVHLGFFPWVGFFIAWLELLGGIALILGVATRVFGVIFGIEMLVATFIVGFSHGLGFEFFLSMVSFGIALTGSGAFSIFKMECENCGGMLCDGTTGVCIAVP